MKLLLMINKEKDSDTLRRVSQSKRGRRRWTTAVSISHLPELDSSGIGSFIVNEDDEPSRTVPEPTLPEALARGIAFEQKSTPKKPPGETVYRAA